MSVSLSVFKLIVSVSASRPIESVQFVQFVYVYVQLVQNSYQKKKKYLGKVSTPHGWVDVEKVRFAAPNPTNKQTKRSAQNHSEQVEK